MNEDTIDHSIKTVHTEITDKGTKFVTTLTPYTDGVIKEELYEVRYKKPGEDSENFGDKFYLRPYNQVRQARYIYLYREDQGIINNEQRTITITRIINEKKKLVMKLSKGRAQLFDTLSQRNDLVPSAELVAQLGYKNLATLIKAKNDLNEYARLKLRFTKKQKLVDVVKNHGCFFNPEIKIQYIENENNMYTVHNTLKTILKPFK